MPYQQLASRKHPVPVCLILDDSGSMRDNLPGTQDAAFKYVERYVGIILKELLSRSSDLNGTTPVIKPRYYILVIIYGCTPRVWGTGLMDIEAAVNLFTSSGGSLGLGGNSGGTETGKALELAFNILSKEVQKEKFKDSSPPFILHLTDGASNRDPSFAAESLKQISSSDGNAILVNGYIGAQTNLSYQGPNDFPGYTHESEAGTSVHNLRLFRMSSIIPEPIRLNLIEEGIFPSIKQGAKAFFDVRSKESLKKVIQTVGSTPSKCDPALR